MEEVKFYDMVEITCKDLSQNNCSETLTRVIAAASDEHSTKLFAAHDDFLCENALQILLTSIAVGNVSAVTYLLARTPVALLGTSHGEGSIYLGTLLQVACEYGDSELVAEILDSNSAWFSLERSFHWNALHVACHLAWATIVDRLSQLKWSCSYSPLHTTSGRGLVKISKSLVHIEGLCIIAGPSEGRGYSPIQLASHYGFLNVLEWLMDAQGCKISPNEH